MALSLGGHRVELFYTRSSLNAPPAANAAEVRGLLLTLPVSLTIFLTDQCCDPWPAQLSSPTRSS